MLASLADSRYDDVKEDKKNRNKLDNSAPLYQRRPTVLMANATISGKSGCRCTNQQGSEKDAQNSQKDQKIPQNIWTWRHHRSL